MTIVRIRRLIITLLVSVLPMMAFALDEPHPLNLVGHSSFKGQPAELGDADWHWLRERRVLLMGVSGAEYRPLESTNNNDDIEGITPDYAQLLAQALNISVEVRHYDTRDEVIEALKQGKVDLLGSANGFEAADAQLVLSRSYANDQPVLVTRTGDSQSLTDDLAGKRVAMLYHYMPPDVVKAFYPNARIELFPSIFEAIAAVAFGRADVYLGDSITANYQISRNHLNNVQMADFSELESNAFAFAVSRDNIRLLRIINSALRAIPADEQMEILRRWSGGNLGLLGAERLHLSTREQRWVQRHPRVRVVASDQMLPLASFTAQGQQEGLSADVLSRISLRTGLKFDVVSGGSMPQQIDAVSTGKADMMAVVTPTIEGSDQVRFTRPYLTTPRVLITRVDDPDTMTLEDMVGKRLAVPRGDAVRELINRDYPGIQFVEADNPTHAMALVANGSAQGAVNSLVNARYLIALQYRDTLQVTSTVGSEPARMTFGVNRGQLELYSILDKALLSIPPQEMDDLISPWRTDVVIEDHWLRHRSAIIQGFGLAAILLLITLGWAIYLRRLIRKRSEAERALSDQMRFMRVLIDDTPYPIYVRDRQGRLMACNSAYLAVFGFKLEGVIGKTVIETDTGNTPQAQSFHEDYLRLMVDGAPVINDRILKVPSGKVLTIYHWMLPYRDADENVVGMIGGWVDVSERQQLLGQLQEAKDEADAANRAKTTFLATMSHEIRTPINAVNGMLELVLENANLSLSDRDALEIASVASRSMLELIGDILDIARIESGHLSLTQESANLFELLTSVARVFEGLARDKGVALRVELNPSIDCTVLVDPLRFKQVVSNLLSNAIKFTDQGHVLLIGRSARSSDASHLNLELSVEDSGRGISAHDQKRLFNLFIQDSNNEQSARSGSGLGLVISRNLCEMMGGNLQLSSVLDKGTRVDVTLALARSDALPVEVSAPVLQSPQTRVLSTLVIDDYPANRLLLARQLSHLGHQVTTAEDGAKGFELWQTGHPDVVITDLNMPVMDGHTLARSIREKERAQGLVPCLLLGFTANAQPEEAERWRQSDMDGCLFKPAGLDDLRSALASLTTNPATPEVKVAFDLSTLIMLTEGDDAALTELLQTLLDSLKTDRALLPSLQRQGNFHALHDLAHRIKGGARMVKAEALIACCEVLEGVSVRQEHHALSEAADATGQALDDLHAGLSAFCNQR
ncbi:hybrid sensor histidine kinase/response regulator [Pseudomonas fluorescens]|uniref:histidine kinase n=1 Tax=Pseudomonas fluorescens TaxID=294 RepID=A0A1T2YCE1_PSEFL|nr:transporter substrate-binding domain-containing protein [Pseudomonas fluorescens]OPA89757.1 hybrid sensor histidine kinase/response regulator [Pseudomonas fluorescens]